MLNISFRNLLNWRNPNCPQLVIGSNSHRWPQFKLRSYWISLKQLLHWWGPNWVIIDVSIQKFDRFCWLEIWMNIILKHIHKYFSFKLFGWTVYTNLCWGWAQNRNFFIKWQTFTWKQLHFEFKLLEIMLPPFKKKKYIASRSQNKTQVSDDRLLRAAGWPFNYSSLIELHILI